MSSFDSISAVEEANLLLTKQKAEINLQHCWVKFDLGKVLKIHKNKN